MKLLATGDWHYREKAPEARTDDYLSALEGKINHLKQKKMYILQPGDLTDTPFLSYLTFRRLYNLLEDVSIWGVRGQHDLRYRNIGNTPLDALQDTNKSFTLLGKDPTCIGKDIYLYGASYGEEVPEITTKGCNILLIHKMITPEKQKNWQEGEEVGSAFLKKHNFDLIVAGDNHTSFEASYKGRHLVNCGSLMRSTIDQIDHKPCYYIYDTDTRKLEKFYVPIVDGYDVFDVSNIVESKEVNKSLEAFVAGLPKNKDIGLKVKDSLVSYMKENKIGKEIQDIIWRNAE